MEKSCSLDLSRLANRNRTPVSALCAVVKFAPAQSCEMLRADFRRAHPNGQALLPLGEQGFDTRKTALN